MRRTRPDPPGPSNQAFASRVPEARGISGSSSQQSIWELYTDSVTRPNNDIQTKRLHNFTWRLRHSQTLFAWHKQEHDAVEAARSNQQPLTETRRGPNRPIETKPNNLSKEYANEYTGNFMSHHEQVEKHACPNEQQPLGLPMTPNMYSHPKHTETERGPHKIPPDIGTLDGPFSSNSSEWPLAMGIGQPTGAQATSGHHTNTGIQPINDWQQLGSLPSTAASGPLQHSESAFVAPIENFSEQQQLSPQGFQLDNVPLAFNGLEDPESWISNASLNGTASHDATSNDELINAALQSGNFALQPLQMYNFFDTQELLPSLPGDPQGSDVHHGTSFGDFGELGFAGMGESMDLGGLPTDSSTRSSSIPNSKRSSMSVPAPGIVSKPLARKKKFNRSPSSSVHGASSGQAPPPIADSEIIASTNPGTSQGSFPGSDIAQNVIPETNQAPQRDREEQARNTDTLQCSNCTTFTTPLWRRDDQGNALCNACGLFFKLHGVNRPMKLKTDVIKRRNRQGPEDLPPAPRRRARRRAVERLRLLPIAPTPPKMSPSSFNSSAEASVEPANEVSRESSSVSPNASVVPVQQNEQQPHEPQSREGLSQQLGVSAGALGEQRSVALDPVRDVTWMWPSLMQ